MSKEPCVVGREKYEYANAIVAAAKLNGQGRVYMCQICGEYHVALDEEKKNDVHDRDSGDFPTEWSKIDIKVAMDNVLWGES